MSGIDKFFDDRSVGHARRTWFFVCVECFRGLSSCLAVRTLQKDLAQLGDERFFSGESPGVHQLRLWDFAHRCDGRMWLPKLQITCWLTVDALRLVWKFGPLMCSCQAVWQGLLWHSVVKLLGGWVQLLSDHVVKLLGGVVQLQTLSGHARDRWCHISAFVVGRA